MTTKIDNEKIQMDALAQPPDIASSDAITVYFNDQGNLESLVEGEPNRIVSGSINNLSDLPDFNISTPQEGDVLTYRSGNWVNEQPPAGILGLEDFSDVDISTPVDGETLVYMENTALPAQDPVRFAWRNAKWRPGVLIECEMPPLAPAILEDNSDVTTTKNIILTNGNAASVLDIQSHTSVYGDSELIGDGLFRTLTQYGNPHHGLYQITGFIRFDFSRLTAGAEVDAYIVKYAVLGQTLTAVTGVGNIVHLGRESSSNRYLYGSAVSGETTLSFNATVPTVSSLTYKWGVALTISNMSYSDEVRLLSANILWRPISHAADATASSLY